jgi:TonB family protein
MPARGVRVPKFTVESQAISDSFLTRLSEFLTERPVKLPKNAKGGAFSALSFGGSFLENLRDYFRAPALRGKVDSRILYEDKSMLAGLWEQIKYIINPPKLPPLKVTSKPVPVKDIWSKDENMPRATVLSAALHVLAVVVFMVGVSVGVLEKINAAPLNRPDVEILDLSPYIAKLPPGGEKAGGGGGGGERMNVPPSKGRLPKFSLRDQLTPPMATIRNPNPKLAVEPTVVVPPDIIVSQPNIDAYGDPLAKLVTGSGGPGSGGGIGTGSGGGVGSGSGPGVGPGSGGGIGGGVFKAGRGGVGVATCAYCPYPLYPEEARKAKFQGTVVLRVVITADGKAVNISVARGPGMGMEEKAMEAVKDWRFNPAIGPNGKPVAVEMLVEVTFRLL